MDSDSIVNIPMKNGVGSNGRTGQPVLFTIDGKNTKNSTISCRCTSPTGRHTEILIFDNSDGTYGIDLNPTESGLHTVEIESNGAPIPGSPYFVKIMEHKKVQNVRVYGPGLQSGLLASFKGEFKIDTSVGGEKGALDVSVTGPDDKLQIHMKASAENKRIIDTKFNPASSGVYTIHVMWNKFHIAGSPFKLILAKDKKEFDELSKLK